MQPSEWIDIIVSALTGLAIIIPLVFQLVKYVKMAVKEKNWTKILELVMKYMEEAEKKFESGADREEWVIAMIKASADTVNFDIDIEVVRKIIKQLCAMSKVVNAPEPLPEVKPAKK